MPNENSKVVFTPVTDLANDHLMSMPEPSEHAIAAEQEDKDALEALTDDHGTPFDPDLHVAGKDGNPPPLTAAGRWRKRPGRKNGGPSSSLNIDGGSKGSKQDAGQDGYRESAEATVDTIGTMAQMFGGEAYTFRQLMNDQKQVVFDERLNGVRAFERLYREKNVADIPPGVAVTLWALMFIGSRIAADQHTKSKIKLAWHWLVSKVTRKKLKKPEKKENTLEA